MSSLKQIEANRRNGSLSEGPKTIEGKAASSKNSIKHGMLSREALLPDEDAEEFEEFSGGFRQDLKPVGAVECSLVERIVGLAWRLRRLGKLESGILTYQYWGIQIERSERNAKKHAYGDDFSQTFPPGLQLLKRDEVEKALSEREEQQRAKESDLGTYGEAFIRDSGKENALTKLSRYETAMTRNLHRTMHELQRLQAQRAGKDVPVPLAVDVDITAEGRDESETALG